MDILTKEDWWEVVADNTEAILDMLFMFQQDHRIVFDPYVKSKDWEKLHELFEKIWHNIPNGSAQNIKGFYSLCDLCSETWVFDDDNDDIPEESL
jgi:hypothetical protein